VNPRVQVEHTVTEEVTGIDIVRAQILIAEGKSMVEATGCASQYDVKLDGHALQCRVTTEDPQNNFIPDYGRITAYRGATGMGIRLDGGTAYSGAVITRYYDSLLEKVTAWAPTPEAAIARIEAVNAEALARLAPVQDKAYAVLHDAFQYFDAHYSMGAVGSVMALDAERPSAKRIRELKDALSERDVVCLFLEPQYPERLLNSLKDGTDARIARLDPLGASIEPGVDAYPQLIADLAGALSDCLGGGQ
jgi:acetyl/propionyl-CoA carboxylase alpha subunit